MVQANKAANNFVFVCRLHYINTLKRELNGTQAYEATSTIEKCVVNGHSNLLPHKFSVNVKESQYKFPLFLLQTLALVILLNSLNY